MTTPLLAEQCAGERGLYVERGGVGVLFDLAPGRTPAIVSWGPALGLTTRDLVDAACLALQPPVANNGLEFPERVGILPCEADGFLALPGVQGARRGGSGFSPRLELGPGGPDAVGLSESDRATTVTIPVSDTTLKLAATIDVELDDSGLLRARATLRNTSSDEAVSGSPSASGTNTAGSTYSVYGVRLAFPVPARAQEILDFAGRWSRERDMQRSTFQIGDHVRENLRGRTGADSAYVLHALTPGTGFRDGEAWGLHVGFSGNHEHRAVHTATGTKVLMGSEILLPGEVQLGVGEEYVSPWVYASYGRGLDAVAGRFHTWLRARPTYRLGARPVTLNVWEAVYFEQNLDVLTALADKAARIGVERFVIDDGWFSTRRDDTSGLGDWTVSTDLWPEGLQPLTDHVRELGMQVGLWFEPEMVNENSEVARAHPEWIMAPAPDRLPPRSRHQQVLNLAIPEAFAHVHAQMRAVISELGVDYIKWDHNRDLVEAGDRNSGRAGVHEQTLAAYRLVRALKAEFPHLEIEACSSGGSRVDLGAAVIHDRVWASDCIDPHERAAINQWTLQLLPPEMIGSHVASGQSHTTGRVHSLAFRAGVSALFSFGIEWDLTAASERELEELAAWIQWHKSVRDFAACARVARVDQPGCQITGLFGDDQALYYVAVTERSSHTVPGAVAFPVPDAEATYAVRIEMPSAIPGGYTPAGRQAEKAGAADPAHGQVADGGGLTVDLGILPGALIESVGVQLPLIHVDEGYVLRLQAV